MKWKCGKGGNKKSNSNRGVLKITQLQQLHVVALQLDSMPKQTDQHKCSANHNFFSAPFFFLRCAKTYRVIKTYSGMMQMLLVRYSRVPNTYPLSSFLVIRIFFVESGKDACFFSLYYKNCGSVVQLLCSSISIVFQRILVSVRFNDIGPSSGVSWLKKIAAFRVDSVFWSGLDTFKLRHLSGYSGQMDQINNFFDKKLMSESFKVS